MGFPLTVVGAAAPAAVCRLGLCPCCPDVGMCLSGVYHHHRITKTDYAQRELLHCSETSMALGVWESVLLCAMRYAARA